MTDEATPNEVEVVYTQLTQVRVPLEQAGDAFATRDASGRIPIVLIPAQLNRVRNEMVIAGVLVLLGAILLNLLIGEPLMIPLGIIIAIVLIIIGVYRSFIVRVPEGANALLAKGGRYTKTIGSGTHFIQPFIVVTHLVTRREIPFDVPVVEAPTKDNVRAGVDTLVTFNIADPYKFVYSISADDFDQVFQAACQDGLRRLVRSVMAEQVADIAKQDLAGFREQLGGEMEAYGVKISKVTVTFAQPSADVIQSLEARQLATVQQAEQAEKQALAVRRQKDTEELAHQEVLARIEREKELLRLKIEEAKLQRQLVEMEAETEEFKLAKLEQRLKDYPNAADWLWAGEQLEVSRALAGNSHAVLQIGKASEILSAFAVREMLDEDDDADDDDE
ncbi:MAG TPA: SPFH domain-containing protein [Anaerolineae bacterium]|nr:SPFH domain-containing protein [Anaerolineae bacterium]